MELPFLNIIIKNAENGASMEIFTNQQKPIVILLFHSIADSETSK